MSDLFCEPFPATPPKHLIQSVAGRIVESTPFYISVFSSLSAGSHSFSFDLKEIALFSMVPVRCDFWKRFLYYFGANMLTTSIVVEYSSVEAYKKIHGGLGGLSVV